MPLPLPLPDLAALDLLVTVGQLGSINAAAEVHGVSQPAASMRLRHLERTLGMRLLERARTGSHLTECGQATVEWAAAVLDAMQALQAGTAALRRTVGSQLRLGASLTVAEYLVPGWLRQLAVASPGVAVALEMGNSSHVVELVDAAQVDLGFIEAPAPPRRLRSCALCQDALVVVVGPDHPWARRRRPLTPQELAATPLILREHGSGTRDTLAMEMAAHGLEVRSVLELGSTTAIKGATMAGGAPAVLSRLAVDAEVRGGQLVIVGCQELRLERTIRAIWAPDHPPAAASARLLAIAGAPGRVVRQYLP